MEQKLAVERLIACGIRPTQQRIAVYDYLCRHRTHPSAETVYGDLIKLYPAFSRTTVYNTLHLLVNAGLVKELSLSSEEKHYDGDTSVHGHFCCDKCGKILDVWLDSSVIESLTPKDCRIKSQNISFSGVCPTCGGAA